MEFIAWMEEVGQRIVLSVLLSLLTIPFIYLMQRVIRKSKIRSRGGELFLYVPKFVLIVSFLFIPLGFYIFSIPFLESGSAVGQYVSAIAFGIFFLFFCGSGILFYSNSGVRVNETEIEHTTMFGQKTRLYWSEIDRVEFVKERLELGYKNKKLRITHEYIGFTLLLKIIENRFESPVWEKPFRDLEEYLKKNRLSAN